MHQVNPLDDQDLERLGALLDALPAPLEPLDVSALDGFLCGVLLQPRPVPATQWLPCVTDIEARPAPPGPAVTELQALAQRRHAELDQAIGQRQWFDPWVFALDEDDSPTDSVLPWVAGFAAAMDRFPALMAVDDPELVEPLALLYLHFDPADGRILSSTVVTDGFLRGGTLLDEHTLLMGSRGELITFHLPSRQVLGRLPISADPKEAVYDIKRLPEHYALPPLSFEEQWGKRR